MILDPDSYALVNAIDDLLEDTPDGEIKPELMESVLEISTNPCEDMREAAAELRALRRQVRDIADKKGLAIGSAGTHPIARWEDQRITAAPRYRDLVDELRFVARQELIFGLHVHVGARRPRQGDPRRQRHARARADPARAERQLAVLARRRLRAGLDADADLPPVPARRHPALLRGLGRLRAADRLHGRGGRDGGLHLALVRRPPAPELRHGRDPGDGRADPRRAHARAGGADPGDGQGALPSTSTPASSCATTRTRCSTRTSGWPRGTGSRASWSTSRTASGCPPRRSRSGCYDRLREHAQDLGAAAELEGIIDLLERGNGAYRQRKVYEANRDFSELLQDIVAASAP